MFEILTKGWMLKLRCCGRKFSTNQVWRKMMQETIYSWCSRVEHFQYILSLYYHIWEHYNILSLPIYSWCSQFEHFKAFVRIGTTIAHFFLAIYPFLNLQDLLSAIFHLVGDVKEPISQSAPNHSLLLLWAKFSSCEDWCFFGK